MPRFALLLLLLPAGCGPRAPVIAVRGPEPEAPPADVAPAPRPVGVRAPVAVAPAPRAKAIVVPKVEAPRAAVVPPPTTRGPAGQGTVAAERAEWERRQKLRATGAMSADEVDDAEAALHAAAAAVAAAGRDVTGERAAREAEVKVLQRQHDRAAEAHRRAGESPQGLDARLAALAAGRIRLAEFERDQPALVREHTVLVDVYRRQLEREQKAFAAGAGTKQQVQECESALAECRRRLAVAEALKLTPRRVD